MVTAIRPWLVGAITALTLLFSPPLPAATEPVGPEFSHYSLESGKATAEACLEFSQTLDGKKPRQYEDYLTFSPELRPALRVDEKRLCLSGLAYGQSYDLTIKKGLPGANGGKSRNPVQIILALGNHQPTLQFASKGAYILPRQGSGTLSLETINMDEVWITIHRLGERILVPEMRSEFHRRFNSEVHEYELRKLINKNAVPIWSGTLKVKKLFNQRVFTRFPFGEMVKNAPKGVYLVTAQDGKDKSLITLKDSDTEISEDDEEGGHYDYERYGKAQTQWVIHTDIGLSLLTGKDGLHVFARSLAKGTPLANVSLDLLAVNNDILATATTDANGAVRFDAGLLRGQRGLAPAMVMATGGDNNFTVMDLRRPAFDLSDRGVAGRPYPAEVDAFLYADRGIYRPGETVHLTALARTPAVISVANQPLTLVVRRPSGSEYQRQTVASVGSGAHLADIVLPKTAARGLWKVDAMLAGKVKPVGQLSFDVQDFIPQRLKVLANIPQTALQTGKEVVVEVDGAFLYGAPASGLKGEAEMSVKADPQPFPAFKEYFFGKQDATLSQDKITLTMADTDGQGHTRATAPLSLKVEPLKPAKAEVKVSLVEPGGRTTGVVLEKPILATKPWVGIRPLFKGDQVQESSAAEFNVALISPQGEALAQDKLNYVIYEEKRDHHWFFKDDRWQVQVMREDVVRERGTVAVAPKRDGKLSITPSWGQFRLEVSDPTNATMSSYRFQVGWSGGQSADVPDRAEVLADKSSYRAGEQARIHITPPAPGPMQVVVATDRVWQSYLLPASDKEATINIPVQSEWGAGAYVLVTSFRPLNSGKSRDPVRAMGVVWIALDQSEHALQVEMEPPELFRPNQTLQVPVKVTGMDKGEAVHLTLAAVDEGILQLTRFKTPDPIDHFMGKRRLAIEVRDDYGRLLDDGEGALGDVRSGGDSLGAALPVVPVQSTALFSGLVAADENGNATVSLDIPDFNGKLRLMAVAHSEKRVGGAEKFVTVRHPVVGDISLPRFLAPGDEGRLTLLVENMDAPSGQVTIQVSGEGGITLPESMYQTRTMAPHDRLVTTLPLQALPQPGIGKVSLRITGEDGLDIERSWPIAVRSANSHVILEDTLLQKAGESWSLPVDKIATVEEEGRRVAVNYGLLKNFDVAGMLTSLETYPFGCTEQLTSRILASLYKINGQLLASVGEEQDGMTRTTVQQMVNQILERQGEEGTIGLYHTHDYGVDQWLAGYVVEMLLLAKEGGLFVPDSAIKGAVNWLKTFISLYPGSKVDHLAHVLYVLHRAGEDQGGQLRYLHDNRLKDMNPMDQASLGAALYQLGDVARSTNAFNQALQGMKREVWYDHYLASPLQQWARILALALESHQEEAVVTKAMGQLANLLIPPGRMNTLEKAWLLRAAAHMAKQGPPSISVAGDVIAIPGKGSVSFRLSDAQQQNDQLKWSNTGKKEIWRTFSVSGLSRHPLPAEESGITLQRRLLTLKGEVVEAAKIRQNDRLIVSLQGTVNDRLEHHMVLTDKLPAGWEIEGVVKTNDEGKSDYPFLGKLSVLAMKEANDDRFVAAFHLPLMGTGTFHVAYSVRAVTPGRFALPAPLVEDMYRSTLFARGAIGVTVVSQP